MRQPNASFPAEGPSDLLLSFETENDKLEVLRKLIYFPRKLNCWLIISLDLAQVLLRSMQKNHYQWSPGLRQHAGQLHLGVDELD